MRSAEALKRWLAGNSEGLGKGQGPGRPFQPGVSGNPNGRPKIIAEVRDLARRHTADAIAALVAIMREGESDAARVSAANALLDRGYGRPVQGAAPSSGRYRSRDGR